MTNVECVNLIVSVASLVVAVVALVIAGKFARGGASAPIVIQNLYDLVAYLDTRKLGSDPVEDKSRLAGELAEIRRRGFILKQVGFSEECDAIERLVVEFKECEERLRKKGQMGVPLEQAESKEYMTKLANLDQSIQMLLLAIEPKLKAEFRDPFRKRARAW